MDFSERDVKGRQQAKRTRTILYLAAALFIGAIIVLIIIICLELLVFKKSCMPEQNPTSIDINMIRNPKFNERGEYLPFYGYTSLAMCREGQGLERLEEFIKNSELSQFFSPLPTSSYHITLFNVWVTHRKPIAPVKKWMEKNKVEKIDPYSFLPREALHAEMMSASKKAAEIPPFSVNTKLVHPNKTIVYLVLELEVLEDAARGKIAEFRKECSELFGHQDSGLLFFHMTLAYQFRFWTTKEEEEMVENELKKLQKEVEQIGTIKMSNSDVYVFSTMEEFIPYSQKFP